MLKLGRTLNKPIIVIDTGRGLVKVHLLEINGAQVQLGIEAPPDVAIHREEIWKRIKSEVEIP